MSITITIDDNRDYCRLWNLQTLTRTECYCVRDAAADAACGTCNGSGFYLFESRPFEMNLANTNAMMLLRLALDTPPDFCGDVDADSVLRNLQTIPAALLVKETTQTGQQIQFGYDAHQSTDRLHRLQVIALEAARRKQRIVWG